jgi:hypothetical protein
MQTKISKTSQWKSKDLNNQDDLFTEILVTNEDTKVKNNITFFKDDMMSTSSLSYTNSSDDEEEEVLLKKSSHRIPRDQIKVKRIKRSITEKFMLSTSKLVSILLSAPVLCVLVTIATYKTGKTQLLDTYYHKKKRAQDSQERPKPRELLTQDELYYADIWGYTSEVHQVLTDDGYILQMYRIFKKGSNPQGKVICITVLLLLLRCNMYRKETCIYRSWFIPMFWCICIK